MYRCMVSERYCTNVASKININLCSQWFIKIGTAFLINRTACEYMYVQVWCVSGCFWCIFMTSLEITIFIKDALKHAIQLEEHSLDAR